jgi:hypothetical protein
MKYNSRTFDNEKKGKKTMKRMKKTMKSLTSLSKEVEKMAENPAYGLILYNREQQEKQERRDDNMRRSSTVHYPDWDLINKKYITRKRQEKQEDEGKKDVS